MSEIDEKTDSQNLDDVAQKHGVNLRETDPDYEAWAEKKIRNALSHDRANPDKRITLDQMWEKHGLAR